MPDKTNAELRQQATAYALNELTPEQEQVFQRFLQENPEVRRDVEVVREVASLVFLALQSGDVTRLTTAQRQRIRQAACHNDGDQIGIVPYSAGQSLPEARIRGMAARSAVVLASLAMTACALLLATVSRPPGVVDQFGAESQTWAVIAVENAGRIDGDHAYSLAQVSYPLAVIGEAPEGVQFDSNYGLNSLNSAAEGAESQFLVMTTGVNRFSLSDGILAESESAPVVTTTLEGERESLASRNRRHVGRQSEGTRTAEAALHAANQPLAAPAQSVAAVDFLAQSLSELERELSEIPSAELQFGREPLALSRLEGRGRADRQVVTEETDAVRDAPTSSAPIESLVVRLAEARGLGLPELVRENEPMALVDLNPGLSPLRRFYIVTDSRFRNDGLMGEPRDELGAAVRELRRPPTPAYDPLFEFAFQTLPRTALPAAFDAGEMSSSSYYTYRMELGDLDAVTESLVERESLVSEDGAGSTDEQFVSTLEAPVAGLPLIRETRSTEVVEDYLSAGSWPPPDVVRVQELAKRFAAVPPPPAGAHAVTAWVESGNCPWAPANWLAMVTLWSDELAVEDVAVDVDFNALRVESYRLVGSDDAPVHSAGDSAGSVRGESTLVIGRNTALYEMIPRSPLDEESADLNAALLQRCRRFGWRPGDFIAIHNGRNSIEVNGVVATDDERDEISRLVSEIFADKLMRRRTTLANNVDVDPRAMQQQQRIPLDDLLTVRVRYTDPESDDPAPVDFDVRLAEPPPGEPPSQEFLWNSNVAHFGLLLRDSERTTPTALAAVRSKAAEVRLDHFGEERHRFLRMAEQAESLVEAGRYGGAIAGGMLGTQESAARTVYEIDAPEDVYRVGFFEDFGYWGAYDEPAETALPTGYWLYAYPKWYIWSDPESPPPAASKPVEASDEP